MAFGTDLHISRAREHLESGEPQRLRYACLELRYALERIAYHKLELRLDKVSPEEVAAWQPSRVMEILMELVDENLGQDFTVQIAKEIEPGVVLEDEFSTLGKVKGISPRKLGKHWHKISSYLHVQKPKKKGDKPVAPDTATLKRYLKKVINYIDEITKTGFDAYFSSDVTFECGKCDQKIVRNPKLLKPESVVQCQNPNCDASHITKIENGKFIFELYRLPIDCQNCGEREYFEANFFLKMKTSKSTILQCNKCDTRYVASWSIKYRFESETDRNKLRQP